MMGGNNIMLDLGLIYFVSFESFNYPKLLYVITMRTSLQRVLMRAYKDQKKGGDDSQYQSIIFIDLLSIPFLNTFIILDNWKYHVKKQVDLNKERKDIMVNEDEIINWID